MDKKTAMRLLASFGTLQMVKELVNNMVRPDHEIIRDVRELLNQIEEETME